MADSYDARLLNFLGEDGEEVYSDAYNGATPATLEADVIRAQEAKARRAEEARLASIPYGTPISQGGTAQGFGVTQVKLGNRDAKPVNGHPTVSMYRTVGLPGEGAEGFLGTNMYTTTPGGGGTARSTSVGRDAYAGQSTGTLPVGPGGPSAHNNILTGAQVATSQGSKDRTNALQSVIDRFDDIETDNTLGDDSRRIQQEATDLNRQLFEKANSYDRDAAAAKFSEESLASALAIARSAPGAQSRESALFNALESLPALQAEGQRQANAEGREQQQVALKAAGQLGQQATQTRSQDEQRAETAASLGLDVARGIADQVGHDLDLDQRDREFLGEVALAVARLNLDRENMTIEQQEAELNRALAREGLLQEWRIFKAGGDITDRDLLGGLFSIGGAVVGGVAGGYAAGPAGAATGASVGSQVGKDAVG